MTTFCVLTVRPQIPVRIIREIFLKGNGIAYFWKDLLVLGGIALTLMSISLLNFKRFISK